jgi:hypothetical protein
MDQTSIEKFGGALAAIDEQIHAYEPEVAETNLSPSERFEALWIKVLELKEQSAVEDLNGANRFTIFPNGTDVSLQFFVVNQEGTRVRPSRRGLDINIFYKDQTLPVESISEAQIAQLEAVEPEDMHDYDKSVLRQLGLMEQTVALALSKA